MTKKKEAPGISDTLRPYPPSGMGEFSEESGVLSPSFVPAQDLSNWVKETFLSEESRLYNPDHAHLEFIDIEFMWAASGFEKQMNRVIGQCEEVLFRCSRWQKGRQEQQMFEWFGRVPNWLITLDASYCMNCTDEEFCALIEHELYHIGQEKDEHGAPKFDRDGNPKIKMRGHDVGEFVGIVERYGVGTEGGALDRMVKAGNNRPSVAIASIAHACGTCRLKVA